MMLNIVRYGIYLIIQDLEEYLRSLELSKYALSKNIEGKSEQPSASAYMLHLHELHRSHILDQRLGT